MAKKTVEDPCFICRSSPSVHGVYREMGGTVDEIYKACVACHARLVHESKHIGDPDWPKKQEKLKKKHQKK